jgi:hypothetical protein
MRSSKGGKMTIAGARRVKSTILWIHGGRCATPSRTARFANFCFVTSSATTTLILVGIQFPK